MEGSKPGGTPSSRDRLFVADGEPLSDPNEESTTSRELSIYHLNSA